LFGLALEGITSFSYVLLRISAIVGFTVSLAAIIYALILVARVLANGVDVPGYSSTLVVILLLGGLQLMSLGIIGEYLGSTYDEVKNRALYLIRQTYE